MTHSTIESNGRPAALVTGSAIRLGKAIALSLAKKGYDIALHYNSSATAAEETAEVIRSFGVDCELFQQDLSKVEEFSSLIGRVKQQFSRFSVLVNSASGYEHATIAETDVSMFDQQFALNLRAPFFLTQAFCQALETGSVINIIDNKVGFNQFEYAAYLLAKKGLVEFTKMSAVEFAPRFRVNGVSPGVVLPAKTRSNDYIEWRIQGIPLQMQGGTDHITDAVSSLLENRFITGQILTVDGGEALTNIGRNASQFDPKKI